jgi:hypothetical protein
MSYIGPLTQSIFDACISECKKKPNKSKIKKFILNPVYEEIQSKIQPYIIMFVAIQLIIIALLYYITTKI